MSRENPEPGEMIWVEDVFFAIVCAPKGKSREEVEEFASKHFSGTKAGWVLRTNDYDGEPSKLMCTHSEDREHWIFEC